MCGICAHTRDPEGEAVRAMNDELVHRGPDDHGYHVDPNTGTALGARRLSVIDVAAGHQPIANENGTVVAALNGEIYNFEALRETLLRRGHQLRTGCDTEVLVHLYEDHGPDLVHALEGMFAFVLWDAKTRVLLAARDRFGEKPLFYVETSEDLVLASEATALTRTGAARSTVCSMAIDDYFALGYVQSPRTIFEDVRQLAPGYLLQWSHAERRSSVHPYWQPPTLETGPEKESLSELTDEARELLVRSMRGRLHADVPVGLFLSGGIDSALVGALAADQCSGVLKTFTVGYDVGTTSEVQPARALAQRIGSDHHELVLTGADVAARAPDVLARLDQPLADQAFLPLSLLAELARESVTVVVGGEGADELFGGYPRWRWLDLARRMCGGVPAPMLRAAVGAATLAPPRSRVGRFGQTLGTASLANRHLDYVTAGRRHWRDSVYGPRLIEHARSDLTSGWAIDASDSRHVAADLMRLDQMHWLPDDVLAKADRSTMLASLEMRTPFLHREIAEFTASVPVQTHLRDGGKALLRRLLRELIGPSFSGRAKRPFGVPAADWLCGPLAPAVSDQLGDSALYRDGWFAAEPVKRMFEAHQRGDDDFSDVLWPLFSLGCWFDGQVNRRGAACAS